MRNTGRLEASSPRGTPRCSSSHYSPRSVILEKPDKPLVGRSGEDPCLKLQRAHDPGLGGNELGTQYWAAQYICTVCLTLISSLTWVAKHFHAIGPSFVLLKLTIVLRIWEVWRRNVSWQKDLVHSLVASWDWRHLSEILERNAASLCRQALNKTHQCLTQWAAAYENLLENKRNTDFV